MNEYITSSVTPIDPSVLFNDGFELSEQNIIPSSDFTGSFIQGENLVEFHIYDANTNHIYSDYNFEGWSVNNQNTNTQEPGAIDTVVLTPDENILKAGYQNGTLYAIYNFINLELNSSFENKYFISQISSDRTEIALQSNFIGNAETAAAFASLKESIDSAEFFDEFYLSFGDNEYVIGINLELQETEDTFNILVKLYEPLPGEYQLQDQVYVATKVGETQAYRVEFIEDYSSLLDNANYIKGPNINIELKDLVNNSTTLKSKSDLLNSDSSQSLDKLTEVLNQKGVVITPNYSYNTFNEFVNFSSAKERINNFVEKVASIQAYQADLDALIATTASNPNVAEISSSIASLETNIQNIIKNFDGFESYQYYTSESNAGGFTYPKTGSAYPYTLLSTTDTKVLEWLGSDVESNQYYGGYRLSASLYDEDNQNWLYYTIPGFIKENSDNDNYVTFSNMVGQHFDEIWLYTKALSERFNTTNDPDSGLPLQLAEEAVQNLGFPAFGNNYNNQDNFIGLTGEDNGSYVPPTGSELITQYIAVNNGTVINYWNLAYSYLNYVEQLDDPGYPYAIDKVSKEIFKRLYHNMAYLTKKKGTISGLRQLINIWGIPNTILRINEFGGKNKDNSDDYDLWYNRYSLAYHPVSTQNVASSSVKMPWMPLERNRVAENEYIVPDAFAFRFKTTGYPSSTYAGDFFTQSLASKKSNGTDDVDMDFGVELSYTPKTSGSYSGSSNPDDFDYGQIRFYLSGSDGAKKSTIIEGPYFDGGWWSVLVQRNQHVSTSLSSSNTEYDLYVKNKQYNGYDGNYIGWEGSGSLKLTVSNAASASYNDSWNKFGTSSYDGLYLGGYNSGSTVSDRVIARQGKIFSGSLQEFRYYSHALTESVFNDFVMNPESIEGNTITGSQSSFDIVNFRAPLGNELEHIFTSSLSSSYSESIDSLHPAITGSGGSLVITGSFVNPADDTVTSSYDFIVYENITTRTFSKPNREVYFLDQPSIGIRNRVSNKIQVEDGDQYGNILSREVSIDQNYQISRSYTEDITSLEVAFSPQDEINDDIIHTFGYGVISDALADPRHLSSSDAYYPKLRSVAEEYFKKYTTGNVYDYLRLIKYFDNSLFKAIKSYVPARTSVTTGVIIKQHMLERNRRPPVNLDPTTKVAINSSSSFNEAIEFGNLEITSSIPVGTFSGGPGGVVNEFNIPQMVTASLVSLTSSAAINAAGTHNPFNGSTYTVTDNVDGLFVYSAQAGIGYNQTRINEEYPTFFEEDVPLIFIVSMVGGTQDFQGTFRLKRDGNTIEEFDHQQNSNLAFTEVRFSPVYQKGVSGSIFEFEFDYDGGSTAFQSFKLGVFASYVNSDDDPRFKGPGIYTVQTQPAGDAVPSGNYVYETNKFNLRQGYFNNIPTLSGSQKIAEIHEREFYDGEYSGSEFISTTQSLFNNPYVNQTLLDTSYDLRRDQQDWEKPMFLPGTYNVNIFFYEGGALRTPSIDQITDSSKYLTGNDLYTLFLCKDTSNNNIHIGGIILNSNYFKIGASEDYGFYPSGSQSGLINTPGGTSWQYYRAGREIPNFYIHVSESWLSQGSFVNDTTAYNQPGGDIWSGGLKLKDISQIGAVEGTNFGKNAQGNLWFRLEPGLGGGTQRLMKGTGDPKFAIDDPNWDTANTFTLSGGLPVDQSRQKYCSSARQYNTFRTGPAASNTPPGSGSLYLMPCNLVSTASEKTAFNYPIGLVLNTTDINGNDNRNTLGNDPSYEVTLNASSSAPTWTNSTTINRKDLNLLGIRTIPADDSSLIFYTFDGIPAGSAARRDTFQYSRLARTNPAFFNFQPLLPSDFNFDNSDFNPIFNNVTGSEANSTIEVIDYSQGLTTPANLEAIKDGSAVKAKTPDSNYTQQSRIIPRYIGSKLKSLTYNTFTPSQSENISSSNGDVIEWSGDISYGNTAVINKNPIYFARFKKSYHNQQLEGTFTFEIDSLIISPQEDITGTNPIPTTIKIDGSNDNLFSVKSTFEVDREATVTYDRTKITSETGGTVDFSQLAVGSSLIFQGAVEFQTLGASTTGIYGSNPQVVYPNFTSSLYYQTSSWINSISSSTGGESTGEGSTYTGGLNAVQEPSETNLSSYLQTSSLEGGSLLLGGGYWVITQPYNPAIQSAQSASYWGPGLGMLHSYNVNTSMSNTAGLDKMGIPIGTKTVDPNINTNYFIFDYTGSNMPGYVDSQLPFIIKRGDEIRATYSITNTLVKGTSPAYKTVTFTVKGITGYVNNDTDPDLGLIGQYSQSLQGAGSSILTSGGNNFNLIQVDPDPTTLGINKGEINNFTIRRRVNADDRVIIYQTPPSGSNGIEEATGGGFIIPKDFTKQQKRNALTLINELRSKSSFLSDDNTRSTT